MIFECIRTSSLCSTEQPCDEAIKMWRGKYRIRITSLKQIMDFVGKYGEIIISPKEEGDKFPKIEIYDTWRE